jgi:hypothetical protein
VRVHTATGQQARLQRSTAETCRARRQIAVEGCARGGQPRRPAQARQAPRPTSHLLASASSAARSSSPHSARELARACGGQQGRAHGSGRAAAVAAAQRKGRRAGYGQHANLDSQLRHLWVWRRRPLGGSALLCSPPPGASAPLHRCHAQQAPLARGALQQLRQAAGRVIRALLALLLLLLMLLMLRLLLLLLRRRVVVRELCLQGGGRAQAGGASTACTALGLACAPQLQRCALRWLHQAGHARPHVNQRTHPGQRRQARRLEPPR